MIIRISFILLVVFFWSGKAPGQEYNFKSLDYADQMLTDQFSCFYEDHEGFFWIGTHKGLYRYDGSNFKTFFHVLGNTNSLSNNNIIAIGEDEFDNLWIGTSNGLNLYNREENTFTWYFSSEKNSSGISHNWIKEFALLKDSSFWIGTREGLNKLIKEDDGSFTFEQHFPTRKNKLFTNEWSIEVIYEDLQERLWMGTWGGGIIEYDKKSGEFSHYYPPYPTRSINDHVIVSFESKDDSTIWAASYNGIIYTFNTASKQFTVNPDDHPVFSKLKYGNISINELHKDRSGLLWIGASKSLMIYNPENKKIIYEGTLIHPSVPGKFKDQAKVVYEDKSGIIWIGYTSIGIDIYDKHSKKLQKWHYDLNTPETYRDYITEMRLDNHGVTWLSTWGNGLLKYSDEGHEIKRFMPSDFTGNTSSNIVTDLALDVVGNLWLSTQYGLICFDRSEEIFTRVFLHEPDNPESLTDNHIYKIIPDHSGFFWIISQESTRAVDPVQGIIRKIPFVEKLELRKIVNILKDTDDNYWFGAYSGLCKFTTSDSSYTYYKTDPYDENSLYSNEIRALFQDSRNNIWIGTNNGINALDPSSDNFIHFPGTPIALNSISGITEDKLNNIWFLTYRELISYNLRSNQITRYTKDDGLSQYANSLTCDRNGHIQLCDEKGFYRIDPENMYKNMEPPPVYITQLYLSGKPANINERPLNGTTVTYKESITLRHNQNNFGFSFVALNYRNPEKNNYQYKLKGHNDQWINNGNINEVTFMNLSPGEYNFMVKGSNDDLVWNDDPPSLQVTVLPPPWKTWWAFFFYTLLVSAAILLYRAYTISREREKSKLAIDQMKLSFFINVSHELRTPLTLVTGPLERILDKESEVPFRDKLNLIYRNASRMQHLVNQILDIRKIDVGKLTPVVYLIDFKIFIDNILTSFKSYAEENQIEFYIYTEISKPKMWFDPDMLEKTISNLLLNAFKHTPQDGQICISVQEHNQDAAKSVFTKYKRYMHQVNTNQKKFNDGDRFLSIEIADCGEGIQKTELEKIFERFYQNPSSKRHASIGSGIGLSLTRDLIELMHGYLFIRSEPDVGTEITVFIPVEKNAYKNDLVQDENIEYELFHKNYSKSLKMSSTQKEKSEEVLEKPASKEKIDILVVDDNTELLDYVEDILSDKYSVTVATDGEAGLKKAINHKFDLIISDIMMPVMDGLEFCNRIKSDIRTNHIPVILLTARNTLESELEGLDSNADDYITKPFNAVVLKKRIGSIIENRKRIWEKIATDSEIIPQGIDLNKGDEEFLKKAVNIVEEHLSNSSFSQEIFCKKIGMSKPSLYRKINSLTNQSINEFVRNIRLKKAAIMLRSGKHLHIAELGYAVGFSEPSYFTKKFKELFGETPKAYNNRHIKRGEINKNHDVTPYINDKDTE